MKTLANKFAHLFINYINQAFASQVLLPTGMFPIGSRDYKFFSVSQQNLTDKQN